MTYNNKDVFSANINEMIDSLKTDEVEDKNRFYPKQLGHKFSFIYATDLEKEEFANKIAPIIKDPKETLRMVKDAGYLYYDGVKASDELFRIGGVLTTTDNYISLIRMCIKTHTNSFKELNVKKGDQFLSSNFVIVNYKGECVVEDSYSFYLKEGGFFLKGSNFYKLNNDGTNTMIGRSSNFIETTEFYFVSPDFNQRDFKLAKVNKKDGTIEYFN